jgi:hypothetical protein
MRFLMVATILCVGAALVGCESGGQQAGAGDQATPVADASESAPEGCPLTTVELSETTSMEWELAETRKDHPLETMEQVKVTACMYTAPEVKQTYGDPLVLRVDVVAPADADAVKTGFSTSCADLGGVERPGGGGTVCDRDGTIVDGYVGDLTVVAVLNADDDVAARLSPTFEKILASAG